MNEKTPPAGYDLPVPRLTDAYIEALIVHEDYYRFPGTRVTVCCFVLVNGFEITGEAVCANPDLFDLETGKRRARKNTLKRVKDREQYLLRQRLYEAGRLDGGEPHDSGQ